MLRISSVFYKTNNVIITFSRLKRHVLDLDYYRLISIIGLRVHYSSDQSDYHALNIDILYYSLYSEILAVPPSTHRRK